MFCERDCFKSRFIATQHLFFAFEDFPFYAYAVLKSRHFDYPTGLIGVLDLNKNNHATYLNCTGMETALAPSPITPQLRMPTMQASLSLLPQTVSFLARKPKMLIGDHWLDAASGATMPVRNPANGEVLCDVPMGLALCSSTARRK